MLANPAAVRRPLARVARVAIIAVIAIMAGVAGRVFAQEKVNPRGAAMKGFSDRVEDYLALSKKLDEGLSISPTKDTGKTEARQDALATRIREARRGAKRGDVFGDAEYYFREVIRKDAEQRSGRDKQAAMEEVPRKDPLKVNASYPETAPLATVPPLILAQLQRLPDGLEYRFMGRDLVLRDVKTNLIVDFINEAVPAAKR